MAGHSRWKNIKHRKAASDARRGKMWSKAVRAVMAAARSGGGDPATNLSLRYALDEARYCNVPRDTIERAIKKATGEVVGADWEPVRYEAYGPGGVALVIDALTDNRTRTAGDLRLIFANHGGNLGASGCVAYMFQPRGVIAVSAADRDDEAVMEAAIEAGALDVQPPDSDGEPWAITTEVRDFHSVREGLERRGMTIAEASLAMVPDSRVSVRGEVARQFVELVEALEDNDDVQRVHSNADVVE